MITFGEESDSQKYAFDTDDLPSPNDRDSEKSASAYAKSFDIAMECAKQEKSLPEVLKKIHEVAIGEVNWKRTMAELESVEFANETDSTSGNFRPEMSSRLTIAHGRKGVVYDIPRVREATQLINELNTMLQDRIQVTQRVSDEYFELAAAVSLLTYISQPFLGGNKRTVRPEITYVLTRVGLTGKWLDIDESFKQPFKDSWANLVLEFQETIDGKDADKVEDYDEIWLKFWSDKVKSGEILSDPNVHQFANAIRNAPHYDYAQRQKVA